MSAWSRLLTPKSAWRRWYLMLALSSLQVADGLPLAFQNRQSRLSFWMA